MELSKTLQDWLLALEEPLSLQTRWEGYPGRGRMYLRANMGEVIRANHIPLIRVPEFNRKVGQFLLSSHNSLSNQHRGPQSASSEFY